MFYFNTDNYELIENILERGALGTTYITINKSNKQKFVEKILNSDTILDRNEQIQFLNDFSKLQNINHPFLVNYIGVNLKSIFELKILIEYMPHESLKEIIYNKSLTKSKKYNLLLTISDAMSYLHKHGIVHRDLKPQNIFVDLNKYPHISDYGLSKCIPNSLAKFSKFAMTSPNNTLPYMAPELLRFEDSYDPSVDVYSFSIIAYEIITGRPSYNKEISPFVLASEVMSGYRPTFTKEISEKMQILLTKCWNDDPMKRPSFDEIFDELSSDFSYIEDINNQDEINECLNYIKERRNIEEKNESIYLQQILAEKEILILENISLKEKIKKIEYENKILSSTNCDLMKGLENIIGNKKLSVHHLMKSSNDGNKYSSFLLGLLSEKGEGIVKDTEKAFSFYEKSIEQGNPRGIYKIGCLHEIDQNYSKAKECFENAAEFGDSEALINLGELYEEGLGVEQDYLKAIEYYEKAAKLGDSDALINIGYMYYKGYGVEQDYSIAKEYYEKAAELGNSDTLFNLGLLYDKGQGVEQDYSKAKEYYERAAEFDDSDALNNLGYLYDNKNNVDQDYSKAIEYYEKAAELGNSDALFNLGNMYDCGQGVEKDSLIAIEYYEKAAELGNSDALNNLGLLYFKGNDVEQNYSRAKEYFEKAAESNNSNALNNLGLLYYNGNGVKRDYFKAKLFYEKAAELGNSQALTNLGFLYDKGYGVEKNYAKAKELYEKAAKLHNSRALINLGYLYYKGYGVERNLSKANEYYKEAAELGNSNTPLTLKKYLKTNFNYLMALLAAILLLIYIAVINLKW